MAKYKESKTAAKPQNDAYTMMLFITFLAIAIGCTLLYLDYEEYGKQAPPKEAAPTLPKLGDAPKAGGGGGGEAPPVKTPMDPGN
jgi:hypothetical protein